MSPEYDSSKKIVKFLPETREFLITEGYLIYSLQGKSLQELYREKGEPVLDPTQMIEMGPGNVNAGIKNLELWKRRGPTTEVAINPNQIFLDGSEDKSINYHQRMVDLFSTEIQAYFEETKAIIGDVSTYTELAILHMESTSKILFQKNGETFYTVTNTPYGPDIYHEEGNYIVEVGQDLNGIRCFAYWLGLGGKYDTGVAPLVVPL